MGIDFTYSRDAEILHRHGGKVRNEQREHELDGL
jgi:hypothetical protein